MNYAVVDALTRTFVTDEDRRWTFDSWEEADALRQAVYSETPGLFLIASFSSEPTSAETAIEQFPWGDRPVTNLLTGGER